MKRILLIATGGTIASMESGAGLTPQLTSQQLLDHIPQVGELCQVDTIQLMNLDSTDVAPCHWILMAEAIEKRYHQYDGFVLAHGTDTMAYTAAALSYLIQKSPKPIVITGAQKPIATEHTDAKINLLNAFCYAVDPHSHGVTLVFDGKVILGTRARKERTKSFNAFSSVDYPEVAVIRDGTLIRYLREMDYDETPVFYHQLEDKILLLTLIPGMSAQVLNCVMDSHQAVILQSFGVGGLPGSGEGELAQAIQRWLEAGKTIVMMTQVPYEGSDMEVYQVGYQVKHKYALIEAYNMTLEAVTTKLMWALGQTNEAEEVAQLFYRPVQIDIVR